MQALDRSKEWWWKLVRKFFTTVWWKYVWYFNITTIATTCVFVIVTGCFRETRSILRKYLRFTTRFSGAFNSGMSGAADTKNTWNARRRSRGQKEGYQSPRNPIMSHRLHLGSQNNGYLSVCQLGIGKFGCDNHYRLFLGLADLLLMHCPVISCQILQIRGIVCWSV